MPQHNVPPRKNHNRNEEDKVGTFDLIDLDDVHLHRTNGPSIP